MSHFSVLVITKPGESIEKVLQPFHEFECTGTNDEHVQDVDITSEAAEEFNGRIVTRLRDSNGKLHCPYENKFYREPISGKEDGVGMGIGCTTDADGNQISFSSQDWGDGKGYRAKVKFIPEGYEEVEVSNDEVETFANFVSEYYGNTIVPFGTEPDLEDKHKYGYTTIDENGEVIKSINRTNPNAQWDWYAVGGRWQGFFKIKPGHEGNTKLGEPSWGDDHPRGYGYADQLPKGSIDWQAMCDEHKIELNEKYDKLEAATVGLEIPLSWGEVGAKHDDIKDMREEYNAQPFIKACREARLDHFMGCVVDDFCLKTGGRSEYIEKEVRRIGVTFAVVKNGEWYQKGSMGWWGIVTDAKDQDEWNRQYHTMLDQLPDDAMLTMVDCHI